MCNGGMPSHDATSHLYFSSVRSSPMPAAQPIALFVNDDMNWLAGGGKWAN